MAVKRSKTRSRTRTRTKRGGKQRTRSRSRSRRYRKASRTRSYRGGNEEVEMYRIHLEPGKYYETAECTRKTGKGGDGVERYYTTNPPRYVGKFIKTERSGFGDGMRVWSIFDNNGEEVEVDYSYEGNTCFRETTAPSEYILK